MDGGYFDGGGVPGSEAMDDLKGHNQTRSFLSECWHHMQMETEK